VRDPKEQFYELSVEQDKFYDKVIKDYFGPSGAFHGAIYHPQAYLKDKEGTDEAQENLYQMLRSRLVQRFESSFGAFKMSVKSVKRSLELSLKFVERMNTFLYSRKAMDKILNIDDYEDAVAAMLEAIREQEELYEKRGVKTKNAIFYDISAKGFDGKRFVSDIKEDIGLMGKILEEVEALKLDAKDPKAAKLVKVLKNVLEDKHPDIPIEEDSPKRKVIVFSTFKDTIVHIRKWAEKAFPGKVLVVTGDNFGKEMARSVKENFDASFDVQKDEYDVLLTTDKLSEGFNLNRSGLVINYDIPWNPTRVIQRVGRINRIGRKVFENLYIFNFFPTVKGSSIVANRAIAENKMFAIHEILGEDAKIFSIEEEPTPSGLYSKVSHFGEDEAMIAGIGKFEGISVVVIGQEKGNDIETRMKHNFGMAKPEGYRKAQRLMDMAHTISLTTLSHTRILRVLTHSRLCWVSLPECSITLHFQAEPTVFQVSTSSRSIS
jgi:hypothetical protein